MIDDDDDVVVVNFGLSFAVVCHLFVLLHNQQFSFVNLFAAVVCRFVFVVCLCLHSKREPIEPPN